MIRCTQAIRDAALQCGIAPEAFETIVAKVHELHDVTYDPSEVMATVGASMAIYAAIRACVGPGDNAVIISPVVRCGDARLKSPLRS